MYSGGLDSLIAYYYLKHNHKVDPVLVYCDIGHRYFDKELLAIERIKEQSNGAIRPILDHTLSLGKWEQDNANIPMRNMFLAMVGSYYGNHIHVVCQKGEQDIPDRGPEFFAQATDMITFLNDRLIKIYPTFQDMTKTEMVKWYLDNGFDPNILKSSISCYSSTGRLCGRCSSCFRRWVAMSLNGIEEKYDQKPWEWVGVPSYVERIKTGKIHPSRVWDIKSALQQVGIWKEGD